MIALVYGTTAELVKLAPLHERLRERGTAPLLWCTAQQFDELPEATRLLGLPEPDLMLARGAEGHSLRTSIDACRWLATVLANSVTKHRAMRSALRSDDLAPCVLVHGDTMTTVLGAALGRTLRATVGHVEAGLRSHDWRHPFPEEIDRRMVGRLARLHYAPGQNEVTNLARSRGSVVLTGGNTVRDSVRMVPADLDPDVGALPEQFGLVSLHRLELLQDDRFALTLQALKVASATTPLVMVYDPVTDEQIERRNLSLIFDGVSFRRIPKLPYFRFVSLLRRASFVVTDSGGLQEECAFIGKPCLVHRVRTERSDGIGTNARLSGMNIAELERFLANPNLLACAELLATHSPSDVIVADLVDRGLAR
ncbi:MAG: putative epimerase [Acidimicrobiaceae bacterium]|nr:MAG: putative epimerase [Acidimicrobiaceae bacterium]